MSWDELVPRLARLGIAVDAPAIDRLRALQGIVLEANRALNLTRIVEPDAFADKHVLDSLAALLAGEGESWADIGAGGGFPGLAIAIARPRARVLLVETLRKKADFLERAARELGLENVTVAAERAEDAARSRLDSFQRATARAVGSLPLVLEYSLPFLAVGGAAVLFRGPSSDESDEMALAEKLAPRLGGGAPRAIDYDLAEGKRRLIVVPKVAATPAGFPRKPGMADKRPLT